MGIVEVLINTMSDVAKLKMEFLMKLQQGNYEGA